VTKEKSECSPAVLIGPEQQTRPLLDGRVARCAVDGT
jgi:hypothetical protein